MLKTETRSSAIERIENATAIAADWLLHSGVQNNNENLTYRGGVSAWFDLKKNQHSFLYAEITGYAVNAFLFLYKATHNAYYLERASWAGDWLVRNRDAKYGLVVNRVHAVSNHNSYYENWIFTFDQWMIISGLSHLYSETQNKIYLKAAEEMARLLFHKTLREDGSMYPAFDLKTGLVQATGDKWSRQPGSFHAKAILGLVELYQITSNSSYLKQANQLADYALKQQEATGRFVTQSNTNSTHRHPHLYTIEGLLRLSLIQKNEEFMSACIKGVEWVLSSERTHGKLPCFFDGHHFLPFERADVLAQTLRLGAILLQHHKSLESWRPILDELCNRLLSYQISAGPQKGGFFYGQEENGMIHYHVNAWVTMFAVQALWIHGQMPDFEYPYKLEFFV